MKKTVKSLIIAASVAAIAGIGAVSFAAWNAGNVTAKDAAGATGSVVTTAGVLSIESNNIVTTGENQVKLLPWDQVAQVGTNVKMQTFTVKYDKGTNGTAYDSYNYKMTLKDSGTLKLYYQVGSVENPTDPTATDSEWALLTKDTAVNITLEELGSGEDKYIGQIVNVVLVSEAEADMGQTYKLEISAVAK